ncbi:DedA family protein [Wenjunlia tyrosinilytica]|uniref:Membrane protein n=1 Tax=Wenjunlia tyrosinilytica TaxID=1544741 RepID=A0A917ZNZ2_9ACTN|nr:DedA family protein [Wenjunlia tyrosinilytica]GGO87481.1 membrane protein [Wenjunlia tyrosinilytica]
MFLFSHVGDLASNRVAQAAHGALAVNPLDPTSLLSAFGTFGIFVVLFAETGLLVGFFLPGDSLLFTAGLLTATGADARLHLPLPYVLVAAAAGALLGAQTGYAIGRRTGPALLARSSNQRLHHAAERSSELLAKYGYGKAIVLARFIPLVRTVLNPIAGALGVPARPFTLWQVIGGLGWTIGLIVAGHVLGASIPGVDRYLLPAVAVIVVLSVIPVALELRRGRRAAAERA